MEKREKCGSTGVGGDDGEDNKLLFTFIPSVKKKL
jgi:hypothetical protein